MSVDPDPGDADDIITQNEYVYCRNNPIQYTDPDGDYIETALDIASVAYSANQFRKKRSWKNFEWLAFDGVMFLLPIAPGSGIFRASGKTILRGRKAAKTAKAMRIEKLSFNALIKDIRYNRNNYELVATLSEKASGRKYRGATSIQKIYRNKKTGQTITAHTIQKNGRILDQHYRPYAK